MKNPKIQRTRLPSLIGVALGVSSLTAASAGTLPQGSFSASWTTATASSNSLWYQKGTEVELVELPGIESGEHFRDISSTLKVSYGLLDNLELNLGVGVINKSHTLGSGRAYNIPYINDAGNYAFRSETYDEPTEYRSATEATYLTLGLKTGVLSWNGLDINAYTRAEFAPKASEDFFFLSGNDRSHHFVAGIEASQAFDFGGFAYADNNFKYRTAHAWQYEGAIGAGYGFSRYTFSAFYHLLWSKRTEFNCFHDPSNLLQFHDLPLWKDGSAAANGPGWDRHHGPGFSLSAVINQSETSYISAELFAYMKLAGVNTDKSTSFGLNLNYALY